jgi:hypothetical protein
VLTSSHTLLSGMPRGTCCATAVDNVVSDTEPRPAILPMPARGSRLPASAEPKRSSFCWLARIAHDDLWLPAVIADLPRHTDALASKRRLRLAEFRPIASKYDCGEGFLGVGLPHIEEGRLRSRVSRLLRRRHHAADRGGWPTKFAASSGPTVAALTADTRKLK